MSESSVKRLKNVNEKVWEASRHIQQGEGAGIIIIFIWGQTSVQFCIRTQLRIVNIDVKIGEHRTPLCSNKTGRR